MLYSYKIGDRITINVYETLNLQLVTSELKPQKQYIRGSLPSDLFAGKHYMYIYCNLCAHSYVGSVKTKILRVIPIDLKNTSYGQLHTFKFNTEFFIPIDRDMINKISIELRTEDGQLYPLTHGRSLCVLHLIG